MTTPNFAVKEKNPKMGFLKNIVASFTEREKRCAELLASRLGRKESAAEEKIINMPVKQVIATAQDASVKCFITNDRELLNQYYELRHDSYKNENGWSNYNGAENDFDRKGKIAVATIDGKVIGGVRLLTSFWVENSANEEPGTEFIYKNILKKLGYYEDDSWAEIAALVVEKKYRNRAITEKLFDVVTQESVKLGCGFMVGVAVAAICRDDRMVFKSLGYQLNIVIDFPWIKRESYNNLKMFPVVVPIRSKVKTLA